MIFKSNNSGRRSDKEEQINSRIEKLKKQGVEYHYDRKPAAAKRLARHEAMTSAGRRKFNKIIIFSILIICAALLVFSAFYDDDPVLQTNDFILTLEFYDKQGMNEVKLLIDSVQEQKVIPRGTRLTVQLWNRTKKLKEFVIPFTRKIVIKKGNPFFYTFSINNALRFDLARVCFISDKMQINGDIKIGF
ncbi:MAG TPA: hypothetical protein VKS21_09210 [Spirochaetota bacterium]|nr:hypothetical protein [Spirochaetota bacterium]